MPAPAERPINVYRVNPLIVWSAAFLSLVLQTFLNAKLPLARQLDLPMLVVIYFSLVRRSKMFGTLFGTAIGLATDLLGPDPVGIWGIANALVGYLAASGSVRFDLEQFAGRVALTVGLVLFHTLTLAGLRHALVTPPRPFVPIDIVSGVLFNSALAVVLFQGMDRLRRPA